MYDDTHESWEALVRAARDLGLSPEETRAWLREMRELGEVNDVSEEVDEMEAETGVNEDHED